MIVGLLFLKMKMNPDLADDVESIDGIRGFVKDFNNLIVPLNDLEEEEINILQSQQVPQINEEMQKLKIGEYVSIIDGVHKDRYGIIEGTRNGKIEVRLRSEYIDTHDSIDPEYLRYLENPPEINYKVV